MDKRISLALSGGGIRGAAHIGALKYMQEVKVFPEVISGTSAGAMVGAFLADGFLPQEIEEIFIKSKFSFDFNFLKFRSGLFSVKRLEELLKKNLRSKRFEELKTKLFVCATNYKTAKPEFFTSGDLITAILASSAIPLVYQPVTINNTTYIDGGLSRNLPTDPLTDFKLPIIGVHVNPIIWDREEKTFAQKIDHVIHLSLRESLENAMKACTIFIEPEKLVKYSIFDTEHLKDIIQMGYDKTKLELSPQKLVEMY